MGGGWRTKGRRQGGEGQARARREGEGGVEAARANLKAQLHEDKRFGKYPFFFARPERVRLRYRISALSPCMDEWSHPDM